MRFITYEYQQQQYSGVITGENKIYSFQSLMGSDFPKTVLDYIRYESENGKVDFEKIIKETSCNPIQLKDTALKAPIPLPFRDVICLGKNYEDHAKELLTTAIDTDPGKMIPKNPIYFSKNAYPAIGSGEFINPHKNITSQVDYEVELAVIIGKLCDNITPENVEDHIFGYTIINDISARDLQVKHGQWYMSKSLDSFCPMGPCIVDKEEIKFPLHLNLQSRVNGEVRQQSNTKLFIFDIPYVVSELSRGMKLYPGDIIATGTPAGIGHGFNPPKHLKSGDVVECEIEKIGVLINTVI